TVNVGLRQKGRERARNVLDAEADTAAILACVARARTAVFRVSLKGMMNPYGDGHAAERIVEVLTTAPLGRELLIKRAMPLPLRGGSL
ncbi:MAG TPA: UDP-N-acetylglucosamine 2-epimerase, partial [Acidobacteriaceae bacterium]|nr:UDP-N-acetylglucosamine 2-epimerase [Acidobacteriaceae bacterium]